MDNKFIRAGEVAQELSVSKPYAYKLIRQLNEELKEKGFMTYSHENMVFICPPLIITQEQLLEELEKFDKVMGFVDKELI